jgi:vanillate/3-O-methylgallate O-demethylase
MALFDPATLRNVPEGYVTDCFGLPEYTDWQDESMSWKENCYIGDWSFLWERRFRGPDMLQLFSEHSVNSFLNFAVGQAKHVVHCNRAGKVIHESVISRLGPEDFMVFGRGGFWLDYQRRRGRYNASSEPDDLFNFQVSGPRALEVVEKACGQSVRDIKFMRFATIRIAGCDVMALRMGMAGEAGFELQGSRASASQVYEAILAAGKPMGIRRLGGRAAMINHLEACFPTIGTDYIPAIFEPEMQEYYAEFFAQMPRNAKYFSVAGSFVADNISAWYRSPVELGWGKSVKLDHEFTGRSVLEAELVDPARTIRTLVWDSADVIDVYASLFRAGPAYHFMDMPRDQRAPMYADRVEVDGSLVGIATSRGYSYYFRQMLSLCTIDIAFSAIGTQVQVQWGLPGGPQKTIRATVAAAPYKQDNRRVELETQPPME